MAPARSPSDADPAWDVRRPGPARIVHASAAASAAFLADLGTRAVVVCGERLEPWARHLAAGWGAQGVRGEVVVLSGPCSAESLDAARRRFALADSPCDLVVGVGGGTTMDRAKWLAEECGLPCANVPAAASTCAAWSPVSVRYEPSGVYREVRPLRRAPDLLIFDADLLAGTPARLLRAGLADTLAKATEAVRALAASGADRTALSAAGRSLASDAARIARTFGSAAVEAARSSAGEAIPDAVGPVPPKREPSGPARAVFEAIVLLSGAATGLGGHDLDAFAAHPIADALTAASPFRPLLHGERVAIGLVAEAILCGDASDLRSLLDLFRSWGLRPWPAAISWTAVASDERAAVARLALDAEQSLIHHRPTDEEELHLILGAAEAELRGAGGAA